MMSVHTQTPTRIEHEASIVHRAIMRCAVEQMTEGRMDKAASLLPLLRWTQTLQNADA